MPEPPSLLADLVTFVGSTVVAGVAGNEAHRLLRRRFDPISDPATGLPGNRELNRASRESLRSAVQVLRLEPARRLDPDRGWLTCRVEPGQNAVRL